jgi:hypothetical protein
VTIGNKAERQIKIVTGMVTASTSRVRRNWVNPAKKRSNEIWRRTAREEITPRTRHFLSMLIFMFSSANTCSGVRYSG